MADVTVTIAVSDVAYSAWIRTSYLAMSNPSQDGRPLIDLLELGKDERDIFNEFAGEAARDVLKLFAQRQDNVTGTPFSIDVNGNIVYRFSENTPTLSNATSLKTMLNEYAKQAIYSYIAFLWLGMKKIEYAEVVYSKYVMLCEEIKGILYLLHD